MVVAPLAFAGPAERTLTMSATSTTIDWVQPWAFSGELTSGGLAIPGAEVNLQASIDDGATWSTWQVVPWVAATSTCADGITGVYQKMQFRLIYAGDGSYEASESDPMTVTPRVKLGTPVAPASVTARSTFTAYGSLKPQQPKGSKIAKIECYLKKNGSWVFKKTIQATNANPGSSSTRYSAKFSLSKRSWKLVAYSPATAMYAKTTSGNETLKVK